MFVRGQRVEIDLGGGALDGVSDSFGVDTPSQPITSFVGDIKERGVNFTNNAPPKPPVERTAENGFPRHVSLRGPSRFAQNRASKFSAVDKPQDLAPISQNKQDDEHRQISEENRRKLESMTETEIKHERDELIETLDPQLLQAFRRLAGLKNIPPGQPDTSATSMIDSAPPGNETPATPKKKVAFSLDLDHEQAEPALLAPSPNNRSGTAAEQGKRASHDGVHVGGSIAADTLSIESGKVHFPRPLQPPDLDPSSATFLEDLHSKYFPELPADPEKLAWMKPLDKTSSYSTSQSGLDPKDIRFSFSGTLIPPSTAAEIPVTKGLHHHGDAPDAAGYTIPELATLMRSRVASQRCMAFQTAGRILYRLGKGEFGDPSDGASGTVGAEETLGELARGLWSAVEKERIIDICTAESEGRSIAGGNHVSARSYATEAIWLWQKGGGRRWNTS